MDEQTEIAGLDVAHRGISNFGDDLQPAVVSEGPGNRPAVAAVKDPEDAA